MSKSKWTKSLKKDLDEYFRFYEDGSVERVKKMRGGKLGVLELKPQKNGYVYLNSKVFADHGMCKVQPLHRIIYFIFNDYVPEMVDHIDGDRLNNSIRNLRSSDNSRNQQNRHKKSGKDKDLPIGVYRAERKGRPGLWYLCSISADGHTYSTYKRSLEDAIRWRASKELELFTVHKERKYCGGIWSKSRYFSFIRSNLRRASIKYPVRGQVLKKYRRPYEGSDKRTKWEYPCKRCGEWFKMKEIEVDHIEPAGSLKEYEDLPGFCKRLFCEEDNLRILCKACHLVYTNKERERNRSDK